MTTNLAKTTGPQDGALLAAVEQAITAGNLGALTPPQRLYYYNQACESMGLNPLTRPLDFIQLSGKLVLYVKKDGTDQLRKLHGVSITKIEQVVQEGCCIVTAYARDKNGKEDSDVGAVPLVGLKGDAYANAIMKAVTKAKRRVTLSISGLGLLDESELDTVQGAVPDPVDMAAKSIAQVESLKARIANAPGGSITHSQTLTPISDRPPPLPAGVTSAPAEPEVLPSATKPARGRPRKDLAPVADKPPAAPPKAPPPVQAPVAPEPSGGDAIVPFGPTVNKKLDELTDTELRELIVYTNGLINKGSGPRVKAFKAALDEYASGFSEMLPIGQGPADDEPEPEIEKEDPEAALLALNYDEPAEDIAPDYKKIAFARMATAKSEPELRNAWTELFKDAKDPQKINVAGMDTDAAAGFIKDATAARDKRKAELGLKAAAKA